MFGCMSMRLTKDDVPAGKRRPFIQLERAAEAVPGVVRATALEANDGWDLRFTDGKGNRHDIQSPGSPGPKIKDRLTEHMASCTGCTYGGLLSRGGR